MTNDPTILALSSIAQPFVSEYMHGKYSEQDAYQFYVQEASQQGYSQCSNEQLHHGFNLSWNEEREKDPTIRALSDIADPFVRGFMLKRQYSEDEAYQFYVQEASQQGYSQCSNEQLIVAFRRVRDSYR
jgi:hypothetical protein